MKLNSEKFRATLADKRLNQGTNARTIQSPLIISLLDLDTAPYGMLAIIYEYSKKHGRCYLSDVQFGAMLAHATDQPIRRHRTKLLEKGYITTEKTEKGYSYCPSPVVSAMFDSYRYAFAENETNRTLAKHKREKRFQKLLEHIDKGHIPQFDWEYWTVEKYLSLKEALVKPVEHIQIESDLGIPEPDQSEINQHEDSHSPKPKLDTRGTKGADREVIKKQNKENTPGKAKLKPEAEVETEAHVENTEETDSPVPKEKAVKAPKGSVTKHLDNNDSEEKEESSIPQLGAIGKRKLRLFIEREGWDIKVNRDMKEEEMLDAIEKHFGYIPQLPLDPENPPVPISEKGAEPDDEEFDLKSMLWTKLKQFGKLHWGLEIDHSMSTDDILEQIIEANGGKLPTRKSEIKVLT